MAKAADSDAVFAADVVDDAVLDRAAACYGVTCTDRSQTVT